IMLSPASGGDSGVFLLILGAISLLAGALLGFIAFVMRLANNSWPKPILIASAICIVIGGGVCGSLFMQM
ncbi:MAG: hypothetical protein J7497_08050, partial [Chitinophagaceae bacterium]|nr:hypothetical protein [Chitinophagaceae bacterium]